MTFYRKIFIPALSVILGLSTGGLLSAAEGAKKTDKTEKAADSKAQAELKKRVDELQSAMANLGTTLSTQAGSSTEDIKTDVKKQLEELGRKLTGVKDRLANQAGESQDAIRRDLGSLLKDLGDTLNSAGNSVATPAESPVPAPGR